MTTAITPEILLNAYAHGIFPMAEARDDPTLHWIDPDKRGILPLDGFHVPRKLARLVRRDAFSVSVNTDFAAVIESCSLATEERCETWINDAIIALCTALHAMGHAHSVECRQGGELVGGLYGVSLGGAFFGESMFSHVSGASQVALVHLVARLRAGGFLLLDAQFMTPHLARFGATEISRAEYRRRLARALKVEGNFYSLGEDVAGAEILQSITETSNTGCSSADKAGLEANIQPEK